MEEQATKVYAHKEDKVNNMNDKSSDFFSSHVLLQPYNPWYEKNSSLVSEDYKMKDNCEGDEFTPSLSIGEHKIGTMQGDVVNGDK